MEIANDTLLNFKNFPIQLRLTLLMEEPKSHIKTFELLVNSETSG